MGDFTKLSEFYKVSGLAQRIGFGKSPAILVVDFLKGFSDPNSTLGFDLSKEIGVTNQILEKARTKKIPIVLIKAEYRADGRDAAHWLTKMPGGKELVEGSRWVEFDHRLQTDNSDFIITKKFASAFFSTNLASLLQTEEVDTAIITGCTTSGCVRATALDAHQHGFKTIVVREGVGDRADEPHWANLFDLDSKYADVVTVTETLSYLDSLTKE